MRQIIFKIKNLDAIREAKTLGHVQVFSKNK